MAASKFISVGDDVILNTDYIVSVTSYGPESFEPTTLKIEINLTEEAQHVIHFKAVEHRDETMKQLRMALGNILV